MTAGHHRALLTIGIGLTILMSGPLSAIGNDFALCDRSADDPDQGIPACTRLLEPGKEGVNISAAYNNRGTAWVRKGSLDTAIDDFNSAIQRNPQYLEGYKNRGLAWHAKGDFDRAIVDFNQALRLDAKAASIYNARGVALTNKGEFNRAIADFNQAIRLEPKYVAALNNRGLVQHNKRMLDNAVADFNSVIRLTPKDPIGYNNRAAVLMDRGKLDLAIADFDQAIKLNPNNWRSYSSRGEAWRLKGELDRALKDHDDAIRLDPTSMDAYNNRGLTWKDKKEWDRALSDFDEAILLNPNYDRAYANRGEIWLLKGDFDQSLTNLNRAILLNPASPIAFYFRGELWRKKGDLNRALSDFNEALRILPDAVAAFTGRGLTYENTGDLAKAKADFEQALRLSPDIDAAMARPAQEIARARLAEIKIATTLRPAPILNMSPEPAVDPGRRVALVIGNSAYRAVVPLPNAVGDAEAVATAFRKLPFSQVMVAKDLTRDRLVATLRAFEEEVEKADWAVVYYAGHGMEINGQNYVIPIDAKLRSDRDIHDEAVSLERILAATERSKKLRLVILDACRENPFVSQMRRTVATRSIGRGLARIEPEGGTLVVYAAKHGEIALDGHSENSPFVKAFLKQLQKPRIEINKLFRLVRDEVLEDTKRRQEPFTYGSLPGEDFFFLP